MEPEPIGGSRWIRRYQEAVAEYVARHEPEGITDAMNRVAADIDTRLDRFSSRAARRVLERSEW